MELFQVPARFGGSTAARFRGSQHLALLERTLTIQVEEPGQDVVTDLSGQR
jgi:hypothetical protein